MGIHDTYLNSERLKKKIMFLCIKYKISKTEEDDVFQDYCVSILSGHAQHQSVDFWMIDWLRKNKYDARHDIERNIESVMLEDYMHPSVEHHYENYFFDGFESLTSQQKYVMKRKYVSQLSSGDIAKELNLSQTRIHFIIAAAIESLKKIFA